jgi:hypothetical protein
MSCQNDISQTGYALEKLGGRTRARTWDPMIKSHLLYGGDSLRARPENAGKNRMALHIGIPTQFQNDRYNKQLMYAWRLSFP